MRRLLTCGLVFAAMLSQGHSQSFDKPQSNAGDSIGLSHASTDRAQPAKPALTSDFVCQTLQSAAQENGLPVEFLTRLIWQESRFDAHAVSRAGAQGVAQFMPGTAILVGLGDPFDAVRAIDKSAELLQNLEKQFGNLGLAAAAYNAGPKRVQDWLAGRRNLPHETAAYVRIVTGLEAEVWRTAEPRQRGSVTADCAQIVTILTSGHPERLVAIASEHKAASPAVSSELTWGVQLVGDSSQSAALASYYQLQRKYTGLLGTHAPLVLRSQVGRGTYWYRVRVGTNSRIEADNLCTGLRAVGGNCLVQRN